MSMTATSKSGWIFKGFTPGIDFREDPADPAKEQKREHVVYRRIMVGMGAVTLSSEQGNTAIPSTLASDLSASDTGKTPSLPSGLSKMLCTRDVLEPGIQGSGIATEIQEWTAYDEWVAWDAAAALA